MRKLLTTALLLLTMVGSAAPSFAAQDLPAQAILDALKARGITTYLDAGRCHTKPVSGFYVGKHRAIILCTKGNRDLNEEQLDTYRHETMHFIQDCKNGSIDGNLSKVFHPKDNAILIKALADANISAARIKRVYESHNDGDSVPYELEAFLAGSKTNRYVVNLMNTFCPLP